MTLATLPEKKVESIVHYWCAGATEREISDWVNCDRLSICGTLAKVTMANCLHSPTDLLDYDADELFEAYSRYEEETVSRPKNDRGAQIIEPDCGMTKNRRIEACNELLRLLEKHHGDEMRAAS